jgi:hypothetical protein
MCPYGIILYRSMPYLSLSKGGSECKAIAYIKDGDDDEKLIYVSDTIPGMKKKDDDEEDLLEHFPKKIPQRKKTEMLLQLQEHLREGKPPLDSEVLLKGIYDEIMKKKDTTLQHQEIKTHGLVQVLPPKTGREVVYVAGAAGSGKSYFSMQYMKEYKKMFPDRSIYVFSCLSEDETFGTFEDKLTRIDLNDELVSDPIDYTEFKDSLVLFDDVDTFKDKAIREAIIHIRDQILEMGRHYNISCLNCRHTHTDFLRTKLLLNESHLIVVFPHSGSVKGIKYLLDTYVGCDKKAISKILKLPSRWLCIRKNYPQCCIYQHGAFLVSSMEEI